MNELISDRMTKMPKGVIGTEILEPNEKEDETPMGGHSRNDTVEIEGQILYTGVA